MKFLSIEAFVPSGSGYEKSRNFFVELGFKIRWEAPGYTGFERDGCKFILQEYDSPEFAQNLMLSVSVDNVQDFRDHVIEKKLPGKFGIRISEVIQQSYGKEVNIIDISGVCWHFVEG
jgi:hypothetical protein